MGRSPESPGSSVTSWRKGITIYLDRIFVYRDVRVAQPEDDVNRQDDLLHTPHNFSSYHFISLLIKKHAIYIFQIHPYIYISFPSRCLRFGHSFPVDRWACYNSQQYISVIVILCHGLSIEMSAPSGTSLMDTHCSLYFSLISYSLHDTQEELAYCVLCSQRYISLVWFYLELKSN